MLHLITEYASKFWQTKDWLVQFPDTIDLCYHVGKMEKFLCHNHNTVELKKPVIEALDKSQREKSFLKRT